MEKMKLTPTETIHLNCINQFVQDGKSEQEILCLMSHELSDRKSLYRAKKMIKKLLLKVSNPSKLIKNNESKK